MKLSIKIFIGFFLIVTFSIISFYVNRQLSEEVNKNTDFLTNSESVIRNSVQLHKKMIEMQSGFRGFLLTNNANFLVHYYEGIQEIPELFQFQKNLISGSRIQSRKLDSISTLHKKWVGYANALILAKQKNLRGEENSQQEYDRMFEFKLQKEVGKKLNDLISKKFDEFDRQEYRVRQARRDRLTNSIINTRRTTLSLSIATIIIGLISGTYLTYHISKRISEMVNLAHRISQGKFEVIEDKANDELTDLSASLSLMSQKLDKSFKELERKNKELDQFAYVVSHDLKAPLRGMYNIINWIDEDCGEQISYEMKKYHTMLKGRIERLENLIAGLLEYARIGRTEGKMEKVDVSELINEIKELVVPPDFNFMVHEPLPVFYTDKLRLQQVFMNLISNAVKYQGLENKNKSIVVSCIEEEGEYHFSISDTGIGIPKKYHDKIFVMFQTLREKDQTESTGVGLAIVKKIIEEKKGSIKVQSDIGQGASFVFTWPKNNMEFV